MTQSVEERASTLYTVRNDDATPRDVVIEHPVRAGWTLTSGVKPAESSATAHRFRVAVAPKSTATLTVAEMRPIDSQVARLEHLRRPDRAHPARPQRRRRHRAAAARGRGEVARGGRGAARRSPIARPRSERISEDQERVRENLKALKGSDAEKALTERYTRQLSTQEDRLDALRKEIEPTRRRTAPRSSRSCRSWWRRSRSTSSCLEGRTDPDVSDPLRRLPDLAAHLAAALAGPLPGARIHERLSPRLLDGSLPAHAGRDRPAAVLILLFPRDERAARRAHRARRRSPPPRRSDLAARRTPGRRARPPSRRRCAKPSRRSASTSPASPSPAG